MTLDHIRDSPDSCSIVAERRRLAALFREAGIESASLDARLLVEGALGGLGEDIDPLRSLPDGVSGLVGEYGRRRLAGEPVWRILGEREFWGLPFRLSPGTLEPRPDSETVVEAALAALGERRHAPIRILDLGVGSGCLLIALLSECPLAEGVGVDAAPEACATATMNANANSVSARADIRCADWLSDLEGRFDLIVSNPPYIPADDIASLAREVRDHDPILALDGGADGLDAYRSLAVGLADALAPDGVVVLEIGAGQESDVIAVMSAAGLSHSLTRRDLGGHPRALVFTGR